MGVRPVLRGRVIFKPSSESILCCHWCWHEGGLSESGVAAGVRLWQTGGFAFDSGNLEHGALVRTFHLWLIGWRV